MILVFKTFIYNKIYEFDLKYFYNKTITTKLINDKISSQQLHLQLSLQLSLQHLSDKQHGLQHLALQLSLQFPLQQSAMQLPLQQLSDGNI